MATGTKTPLASRRNSPMCKTAFDLAHIGWGLGLWVLKPGSVQGGTMKEFVLKGRLTLERVTFYVSAKTLEGALARAVNRDFDGYDTDAAASIDWRVTVPPQR